MMTRGISLFFFMSNLHWIVSMPKTGITKQLRGRNYEKRSSSNRHEDNDMDYADSPQTCTRNAFSVTVGSKVSIYGSGELGKKHLCASCGKSGVPCE